MGYQDGFTYVSGPAPKVILSTVSSVCTGRARNPVTLDARGFVIDVASDATAIFGILQHNAADSLVNKCYIEMPTQYTVYATKVQTGAATSIFSYGRGYAIEKSGNHFRLDTDSQLTPMLSLIPRDNGAMVDSDDSSVWVTWFADVLGVWGSTSSISIFAQT